MPVQQGAYRERVSEVVRARAYPLAMSFQPDAADELGEHAMDSAGGEPDESIVPDGITGVRWVFARQDQLGFVYRKPITVDVPVRNNVAIATVAARAPCVSPALVQWYSADGHIVKSTGSLANINTITRPVRRARPWGP